MTFVIQSYELGRKYTAAEFRLLKNVWLRQFGKDAVDILYMGLTTDGIPRPRNSGPCIMGLAIATVAI